MLDWYDLNARQVATVFWVGLFLFLAILVSPDVRQATRGFLSLLLKPVVSWPLILLLVTSAASATLLVFVGKTMAFFEVLPIVTVTVWSITTGVSMLMRLGEFASRSIDIASKALNVLLPSVLVAAFVNIAVFNTWIEFILVPFVSVLVLLYAFSSYREEWRPAEKVLETMLAIVGFSLFAFALFEIFKVPSTWRSLVQSIVLPIWLSGTALIYIKSIVVVERTRFNRSAKRKRINSLEYGEYWPFTVESAKLCCKFNAVWMEFGNQKYQLNGTSRALLERYGFTVRDLGSLWREDPRWLEIKDTLGGADPVEPWKVSIHHVIQDGLAMCKESK